MDDIKYGVFLAYVGTPIIVICISTIVALWSSWSFWESFVAASLLYIAIQQYLIAVATRRMSWE
jgi:hypothetical protein